MNTSISKPWLAGYAILIVCILIGLRFAVEPLTAALESAWGPLLSAQFHHEMRWLWAFEGTAPVTISRWALLVVVGTLGSYLLLSQQKIQPNTLILITLVVAAAALYWILRPKIAYGDAGRYEGYMLRGILPGLEDQPPDPKVLFMSSPLSTALFYVVYHVLFPGMFSAEEAVSMVNIAAGVIFVASSMWVVSRWIKPEARWATILLLLTIPATVHFFGYREATSVTPGLGIAYVALALWYLDDPKLWKLLLAALIAGLSTAAHGVGYMFGASLLYLAAGYALKQYQQGRLGNGVLGAVLTVAFYILPFRAFFWLARRNPDWVFGHPTGDSGDALTWLLPQNWLTTLRLDCRGSIALPIDRWCYPVFSEHQFFDLLSGTFRLWPAGLIALLVAALVLVQLARGYNWSNAVAEFWNSRLMFFIAVFCGALGFLLLFPPMLGFIQDWDLFGPSYIVMATVTAFLMGMYLSADTWKSPLFRLTVSLMIGLNLAGLTEFLFWLQPYFFGETLVPLLRQFGLG